MLFNWGYEEQFAESSELQPACHAALRGLRSSCRDAAAARNLRQAALVQIVTPEIVLLFLSVAGSVVAFTTVLTTKKEVKSTTASFGPLKSCLLNKCFLLVVNGERSHLQTGGLLRPTLFFFHTGITDRLLYLPAFKYVASQAELQK